MALSTGGLDQHRAEVGARRHYHLATLPTRKTHRGAPLVVPAEFVHPGERGDRLEHLFRRRLGNQDDDDFADQLETPPDFAGHHGLGDPRHPLECRPQRGGLVAGMVKKSEGTGLAQPGNALEHVLRGLRPEARQRRQPTIAGGGLEFGNRLEMEPLMDQPDLGDPESGNPQHLHQTRRHVLTKFVQRRRPARLDQIANHRLDPRADPVSLFERSVSQPLGRLARQTGDRPRSHPEGAHLERVFALEFEIRGDLIEHAAHRALVDRHVRLTRWTPGPAPVSGSNR